MSNSDTVIRYGSLFSGIEAASLAFEPLGWEPDWFAEIDPFCCEVLHRHWPAVPNLGDVTNPQFAAFAKPVDVIVGGSPCPSFSLAGKRQGIEDPRGLLTLRYCEIVQELQPRWFILENVPGVLSSNNGIDFEVIINEMVRGGYGVCWRVLDARWFGVPQSRQRLFVVGRLGEECPSEVLLEPWKGIETLGQHEEGEKDNSSRHRGLDVIPICMRGRECGVVMEFMDWFGCLRATTGDGTNHVWDNKGVRKLTPLECERLQGMPDNHTKLGNDTPDGLRWKAVGNSMTVPVVRWIGERIMATMHQQAVKFQRQSNQQDVHVLNIFASTRKEKTINDTPIIAPMFPDNEPTENSSLEELATYALLKQDRILARDKMNGEDLWLMGRALEWAYEKTPYGEWENWFKAKKLKKTYVWQARKLHNEATLDEVKELGMTEALRKFGVVPDEKKQKAGSASVPDAESKEDDKTKVTPANKKEDEEPTEAPEPVKEDEGGDPAEGHDDPSDDLADEEDKELKEYQAAIRKLTPKTRAVAILHALEALLDDLKGIEEKKNEELSDTFDQIIELAEAAKELDHDEHYS